MANQSGFKRSLVLLSTLAILTCTLIGHSDGGFEPYNGEFYYYGDYYNYDYMYDTNSTNSTVLDFEADYHTAINNTFALVANFCPSLQMGESDFNVSITDTDYQSCCRPCSVEPGCHLKHGYNFCCPQARMAHYYSHSADTAECITSSANVNGDHLNFDFWHVYYCKDYPHDRTWIRNDFDDVVMVYSNDGVLYRNKHVAECNGITEYTRWRLLVTACNYEAIKNIQHETNLLNDVMRECIVYSAPPPDFDVSPFVCHQFPLLIMYCNKTGLWETYDESIIILCSEGADALVYDTDGRPYRNVYCLTCNKPSSYMSTPKTCTRPFSHELPVIDELTILVAYESGEDFLQHDTLCDTSFVRDTYQKICRRLLCPPGMASYKGECLLLAKDNHQLLQVMLRLSPSEMITNLDPKSLTEDTHRENNERILSRIGLHEECEVQGNDIFTYWTWTNFRKNFARFITYDIHLYKTDTCIQHISSIKGNMYNRSIASFPFKAGLISIDVNIEMTIPFVFNTTVYKKENIASYAKECTNCSSKMIIPPNCPYIKLQPGDVCDTYRLQNPDSTTQCSTFLTSDIFKSRFVVGDELVNDRWQSVFYICARDYNRMFKSLRLLGEFTESTYDSIVNHGPHCSGHIYVALCCFLLILIQHFL